MMRFQNKTQKITFTAILTAVALIVWFIEAQIPPLVPVPGIKLGLSNIVVLFALYSVSPRCAAEVLFSRTVLGGIFAGNIVATIYSFSGGVLSLSLGLLLFRRFQTKQIWVLSVLMAVLHNTGQILAAIALTGAAELIVYLPVLIVSAIFTGAFTGLAAGYIIRRIYQK
jgi:heptaprenyl diphosphate synthase